MGKPSRDKGAKGEREFIHALEILTHLPTGSLRRRLAQYQSGGCDIEVVKHQCPENARLLQQLENFALEIKRHASASPGDIRQWWLQACQQAQQCGRHPVLAFRADRGNWQCLIPVSRKLPVEDVRGCLRMDLVLFAEFLKDDEGCLPGITKVQSCTVN
ncbi:MAG: putative PDDEXK endonuclease [Endozoicomonas sp.]